MTRRGTARTLALGLALAVLARPAASQTELPTGNPTTPEVVRFYHADALGSVRAVTDLDGDVVARYDYLPYGEQIPEAQGRGDVSGYGDDAGNKHKFTAKERDSESNLDYFGARYFSGAQGRFTAADPVITSQHVTDPQRWNGYAYVRNNPTKYVDPDGNVIDTIIDVGFILYDVYSLGRAIVKGGSVRTEAAALAADVGSAVVPGFTGGGAIVRAAAHADDTLHAIQAVNRTTKTAQAAGHATEATRIVDKAAEATRFVPNPGGKLGGQAHRATVAEVAADVESRGLEVVKELKVPTPGGQKSTRYVDVAGRDPATGRIVEMHQVGKQTKKGAPISRERNAIEDIRKACSGEDVCFHPYNK